MAEAKTRPTTASVTGFIDAVGDARRRADCKALARLMQRVTGARPKMWGDSIVGFGSYHYVYDSGREGEAPLAGFSPRTQALTLYLAPYFAPSSALATRLGKVRLGKGCMYIKRLDDVDLAVLEKLVAESVAYLRKKYPPQA